MKAIIISFTMLALFTGETKSQTIPNSGFENWTYDIFSNWNPDAWQNNNGDFQGAYIFRSNGYQGNWALEARNIWWVGQFAFAKCKFPVVSHPASLNAFIKTAFTSVDSVNIEIFIYYNGLVVDSGKWINTDLSPIATWTPISISVTQSTSNVDSVEIRINGGTSPGTSFFVDELSYTVTGITESVNDSGWNVFPNPTINELNIQNNSTYPIQFTLYNSLGEKIIDETLMEKTSTINLSSYSSNIYFYQVSNDKHLIKSGKIIKQ